MEKNRGTKIIAIVALLIAIVGVSVGFAAFSKELSINANATVTPEDTFDVQFSDAPNALLSSSGATIAGVGTNGAEGTATIKDTLITNITAKFKKNNSTVTYNFYVANNSDYIAYLKSIDFNDAATTPVCTEATNTTAMSAACANMDIKITVGGQTDISETKTDINTNNSIAAKNADTITTVPVTVVLTYAGGADNLDEEFKVNFGTITLGYSTSN